MIFQSPSAIRTGLKLTFALAIRCYANDSTRNQRAEVARPDFLQLVDFGKRLRNEIPTYDYDDQSGRNQRTAKKPHTALFPSGAVVRGFDQQKRE
jgi:hypothetical protein